MSEAGPFRVTFDPFHWIRYRNLLDLSLLEREEGIEIKEPDTPVEGEIPPALIRDCDAIVMSITRVTPASLEGVTRLKLVSRFGAGYDRVNLKACTEHGVMVTNVPYGFTEAMAEATVALILACSLRVTEKDRDLRRTGWDVKMAYLGRNVSGKTLGIVGLGNIGCLVVGLVKPFKMRILAYDPYAPDDRFACYGVEKVDLDTLIRESDFVSLHAPLTAENRYMFGEEQFRMMKPTAYFINTARGGYYKEELLARALREKWIAGAAVDVFENEPNIEGNPLLEIENCILTPHSIGLTYEMIENTWKAVVANILRYARGELPENIVNVDVVPPEKRQLMKTTPSYIAQ